MNPQQNFTAEDVKYIADLPNHAGWSIFRDMVQATHDALLNALAAARTDEEQQRLYTEWRAYRAFLVNILNMEAYAQHMVQQLQEAQQTLVNQTPPGVFNTPETQQTSEEHQAMMQHLRQAGPMMSKLGPPR
jgi:hypothetical protein